MHDPTELDHRGDQLDALAAVGETREVIQRGELRRVVGEDRGAAVVETAHVGTGQRPVIEAEDTLDDAIEVSGEAHRSPVAAVLDAPPVRPLPGESLQIDLECAGELCSAAPQHHPPRRRVLAGDLQAGRCRPADDVIPVRDVETVTRGQLGDVEVTRGRVGERLQPREALRGRRPAPAFPKQERDPGIGVQLRVAEFAEDSVAGARASGGMVDAAAQRNGVGHDRPLSRASDGRRRCDGAASRRGAAHHRAAFRTSHGRPGRAYAVVRACPMTSMAEWFSREERSPGSVPR